MDNLLNAILIKRLNEQDKKITDSFKDIKDVVETIVNKHYDSLDVDFSIEKILEEINERYNTTIDTLSQEIASEFKDAIQELKSNNQDNLEKSINDYVTKSEKKIAKIKPKDGKDYIITEKDYAKIAKLVEVKAPEFEIPKQPTPDEIRDMLELLQGDDRLDISAIKGFDEILNQIKKADKNIIVGGYRGVQEAPTNSKTYGRRNGEWVEITGGGGTWGSITGTLSNQTDLQEALNEKVNVSDLGSNVVFYATTASGDFGYNKMVTSTADPDYDTVAVDVPTGEITTDNQLVGALISEAGVFSGDLGIFTIPTIGNIAKIGGNSTQYASFYFEVYKRDNGGTETLLVTSNETPAVNPTTSEYQQFSASALFNDGEWLSTDRVVIKYKAKLLGNVGSEYQFQFGGSNPVRTNFNVPISAIVTVDVSTKVDKDVLDGTRASEQIKLLSQGNFYNEIEADTDTLETVIGKLDNKLNEHEGQIGDIQNNYQLKSEKNQVSYLGFPLDISDLVFGEHLFLLDCTGGDIEIIIPPSNTSTAKFTFKKTDNTANKVIVNPSGTEKVDYESEQVEILFQYTAFTMESFQQDEVWVITSKSK